MLYRGSSADGNYHMGEATSSDGSLPFVRKNNGGVNDGLFNAFGANYDPTSVMLVGSRYYVYMNGSPSHGDQNIYYSDDDFATFTAAPNNPIFGDTGSFCAGVWADGAYYYMLIPRDVTPGGVALYDHGIGLWRSTSPLFTAASREFLGYAAINDQTYDAHYMDTPSVPMMDVHKSAYSPELGSMLYAMYSGSNGTAVTQSLIGINRTGLASLQKAIDLRTMLGNEMAFSLWVQFDQLNAGDPVISVGESATDGYPKWLVNIAKSGGYRFAIFLGGAFQATNVALTTGTPYNLVVTTDDVNTYAYVNGVLAGIFSQRNINAEYTISNLYVGTSFPGTNHLHGYVWDLRVYPEMLSASRVAGIYGVMTTAPTCSTTYTSTTKVNATPPTTSCSGGAVSSNYTLSYVSGTVTITQAAPSITWASSAAITYGTAVGATQLNANSTVAGTFVYTPTAGTVLNVGSQTLSVTFTPNDTTDYSAATATVALTVNQATPSITWANPAAITYGTALGATQLNASSTVAGTFVYTPTAGTVLNAGSQTLSVTLTPTDTIDNSTATKAVNLVVNKATPIEVVTPSSSSITTAQALNVTVAVNPSSGNPTPTGTVTLSGGGYTASPVTLVGGGYIFTIPANSLAVGTDTLTVNYSGDSNYASIAGTASVNVTAIPIVKVTPATTTLGAGDVLNVTAAVTGSGVMPTGTVTLSGGGYTSSASTLSSGSYIFAIPANSLSVGTDTLTVSYSGNSNYAAATGLASVTVMQSVLSLAATTPAGVAAGEGATSTVTVSAITSYAGTVTITCALTSSPNGATQLPTCSNGSSTVTLTDTTTTGTATVTVGTTAPTTIAMSRPGPGAGRGWVGAGGGAILAFLVFFGIPGRQRNWRSLVGMLVVMVALGSIAGCGGGGGRSRSVGTTVPATTAGTYTFTVTATGSPSVTPTPIATFTLTVN